MESQTNNNLKLVEGSQIKRHRSLKKQEDELDQKERLRGAERERHLLAELNHLKDSIISLKENREFYKHLFSRMKEVIVVQSLTGTIEYVSPAIRELGGYEPEEVVGTHVQDYFVKDEEYQYVQKILEAMLISANPLKPIEFLLKAKNMTPFYVEARGYIVLKNNQPVAVELVLRNISKRKSTEIQLKVSEDKYRDLFDNLPDYAFIHGVKGNFIDANNALRKMVDFYGREINQINLKDLVPEDLHPEIKLYLDRIQQQGIDKGIVKIVPPGGSKRLLSYNAIAIKNPQGAMVIRGLAREITEQFHITRKLNERENYYQSVFENSGTCIFILEDDFGISSINLRAANLMALSKEEIEGKANLFTFFTPETRKRHLMSGTYSKHIDDDDALQFDATLVDGHGKGHAMLFTIKHIPSTRKLVASAVEISDRKKAEEILKKTQIELEQLVRKRTEELVEANALLNRQMQERDDTAQKLQQSEIMYRRLFENTGMATVVVDQDGTIAKVNNIFTWGLGYTKEELEGKMNWIETIHPDDKEKSLALWEFLKSDPSPEHTVIEARALKKNGEMVHMVGRVVAFPETNQMVGSFLDTTHIKQTEAALLNSEKRLMALMSNLPGMAYSCRDTANKSFRFISEGCHDITGFTKKALMASHEHERCLYADLIHPDDREEVKMQIERAVQDKTAFQITYRIRTAEDLEKWVLQTGQGVFSETGELISIEGIIIDATQRVREEQALVSENLRLKSTIKESYRFGNIIGRSQVMQNVYELIVKASSTENHVIVYGESGTGKELVARAIHELSDRRDRAFVPVNCGAIPENLIESEFFGYKKGAFTGATQDKKGLFTEADGGTIFLDEIGEITLNMQVKLLRVLEGGDYTPVGTNQTCHTSVRIIGATNRNLRELIRTGKMREDFYYRIHIIPITLPPLRERIEDLPLLMEHFLKSYGNNAHLQDIPEEILEKFRSHTWPGNIRELQNVLFRYITLGAIDFSNHLGTHTNTSAHNGCASNLHTAPPTEDIAASNQRDLRTIISDIERKILLDRLEENSWNKSKTATNLGIDRKTLLKKIKAYQLLP